MFFCFYFVAYEPYRAMYPDLTDEERAAGRAQSTQALARGFGTGLALLGGGLLISIARPLPFAVSAVILLAASGAFVVLVLRRGLSSEAEPEDDKPEGPIALAGRLPGLARRAAITASQTGRSSSTTTTRPIGSSIACTIFPDASRRSA